jgi:y4mF family transcriptional regulator
MLPMEAGWSVEAGDAKGIGLAVRSARKDAGLNQGDLADLAGVSERTVRAIETGTGNPTLAAVVSVANVLGLHLAAT